MKPTLENLEKVVQDLATKISQVWDKINTRPDSLEVSRMPNNLEGKASCT